ncbi:ead/Ea22-like family protein [Enterobacter cloacae]|uniref:ead/Ea22-like family protein n=1 Tax=Enterobacter cloacae TaxID=550 RepID=UPI002A83882F|nr:ead/Ea22-like family protein [Enterobacter cloacae]
MSNIDKRALRKAAMHAKTTDDWGCDSDNFHDKATPDAVLALLDDMEVKDRRIAELEAREKSLRTVGVMSAKAFQRLEGRESRFIALWPRPEIYLPRKRPDDGVIVYARVAGTAKGE